MKIKKQRIILILLLIIGAFLRFHNYGNRIDSDWETVRDYFISEVGWKEKQLPLTGPWTSIGPLTTGPWYWYYLIFSRFFIPSVYAPWIALGLTSLLVISIMYHIGLLLKDEKLGLILALLACFSPNLIDNSVVLTNPSLIVFLSSLSLLLFLEIFQKRKKQYWAILLGWLVGFTLLTHYQGAGLLTLVLLLLFLKKERIKTFFFALFGLFIAALPMLVFELNNHWFNSRGVLDFLLYRQYQLWTSMRWLKFIFEFFPDVWIAFTGGERWLGLVLMFGSGLILFLRFLKKKLSLSLFLLGLSFLVQVIIIRYWRGERYLGWLQFFSPYIFIFTGLLFDKFLRKVKKRYFYFSFLLMSFLWLILISNSLKKRLRARNIFIIRLKDEIKELMEKRKGKNFSFYYCSDGVDFNQKHSCLLMLSFKEVLDDNGLKIGLDSGRCNLPYIDKEKEDIRLTDSFLDFSQTSEAGILENGWRQETPQTIYDHYVKWWYQEKP